MTLRRAPCLATAAEATRLAWHGVDRPLVELEMELALREEYLAWLRGHVAEMLALPGFLDAEILNRLDPPAPPGRWVVCARYRLRDRAAWEIYLGEHAARMREAGLARFGARVQASRRLLEAV